MTSQEQEIIRIARRAAARLTANRSVRAGARASAAVMAAILVAAFAGTVVPLAAVPVATALAAALAAGLVAAVVVAVMRPVDPLTAGRLIDLRLRLDERVSTAVEIALAPVPPSTIGARVLADATGRVDSHVLRQAAPVRLPRETWWTPLLAAFLLIWATWLHGLTIPGTPAHQTAEVIRQEGSRLEQFARSLQSRARTQHVPQTRRAAPQLKDLGVRLQQERIDRAEALARVAELSRQLEQTRREINERVDALHPAPSRDGSVPPELLRRQALQRQVRQLQELASRLRSDPSTPPRDALERLGAITQPGEGQQPAQVRRQLQQAREQLQAGNVAGAGESLTQALRELEGLESLLADEEGLKAAQQQLQRTRQSIAGGSTQRDQDADPQPGSEERASPTAPGQNPVAREPGAQGIPPQGPNEGTTPGAGEMREKLGDPSARMPAQRTPQRVRGAQSDGPVTASEVVGAGRPGASRVQDAAVTPAVVARADHALERARTPGRYRLLVRRYFERLARLR